MRRLLLICLIMLFPFQTVWSAAASACSHEQTGALPHLGHHEAHHDESPRGDHAKKSGTSDDNSQSDHHHFLCESPMPFISVLLGPLFLAELNQPDRIDSYPTTSIAALERPPKDFYRTLSVRIV
jgi:hypothetical protein